jgi:hypothetical protein
VIVIVTETVVVMGAVTETFTPRALSRELVSADVSNDASVAFVLRFADASAGTEI